MAKKTSNNNKSSGNGRRTRPRKQRAPDQALLDAQAAAYARLLTDPCNAPLVHPVYPGGDAGYLFRAESFHTPGNAAGQTAGVIHWAPGYTNASNTQLVGFGAADATTATAVAALAATAPGAAFLSNNAKGVRCVAACMKITFPGAESARAGRIHYGHTAAGMLDVGNSVKVDEVAQTLQHFSRVPPETIEIIWKPSQGDFEFNDPTEAAGAIIRDRKGALTVAWAGLPAATGLTIHYTAVYEWTPSTGLGVGHNALGKNQSNNSFDQVIDYVIKRGFKFVRHAGMVAGSALSEGVVTGIANTFGIMPATRRTRSYYVMAG